MCDFFRFSNKHFCHFLLLVSVTVCLFVVNPFLHQVVSFYLNILELPIESHDQFLGAKSSKMHFSTKHFITVFPKCVLCSGK